MQIKADHPIRIIKEKERVKKEKERKSETKGNRKSKEKQTTTQPILQFPFRLSVSSDHSIAYPFIPIIPFHPYSFTSNNNNNNKKKKKKIHIAENNNPDRKAMDYKKNRIASHHMTWQIVSRHSIA